LIPSSHWYVVTLRSSLVFKSVHKFKMKFCVFLFGKFLKPFLNRMACSLKLSSRKTFSSKWELGILFLKQIYFTSVRHSFVNNQTFLESRDCLGNNDITNYIVLVFTLSTHTFFYQFQQTKVFGIHPIFSLFTCLYVIGMISVAFKMTELFKDKHF